MRCKSCNTDNINEAAYCSSCGKKLSTMGRSDKKGSSAVLVMVIVCLGLFVAAVAICLPHINNVTTVRAADADKLGRVASSFLAYSSTDGKKLICVSVKDDKTTREEFATDGKITGITSGVDCAVVEAGGAVYFAVPGKLMKLEGCRKWCMASDSAVCAYITSAGKLHKCTAVSDAVESIDVMDFVLNPKGDLFYLRNDISPSDDRKVVDKNGFYNGKKYLCAEEPDDKCTGIVCANSIGFYYTTESKNLILVNTESGSKFQLDDFSDLVMTGKNSVLVTKADGCTYIWHESNQEELYAEEVLVYPIIPENYVFTGDKYTGLLFAVDQGGTGTASAAGYVDDNSEYSGILCDKMSDYVISADCGIFYCRDAEGVIWRYNMRLGNEVKKCTDHADLYCISQDGKTLYYTDGDSVYAYDGYNTQEIASLPDIDDMAVSDEGFLILRAGTVPQKVASNGKKKARTYSLYVYRDDIVTVLDNEKGIEFCGMSVFGYCYADKTDVHIITGDGTFMTPAEMSNGDTDTAESGE